MIYCSEDDPGRQRAHICKTPSHRQEGREMWGGVGGCPAWGRAAQADGLRGLAGSVQSLLLEGEVRFPAGDALPMRPFG